jgi:hypothetical protein
MTWKTFDFNAGTELNRSFLERLKLYLEKRESQIAWDCLCALDSSVREAGTPQLSLASSTKMRLSQSVDEFNRKIHDLIAQHKLNLPPNESAQIASELNSILWNYVEFLEGAITELFFEVERVDLRMWSSEIMEVVREIKRVLACALDEIEVTVNGLNNALSSLRDYIDPHKWSVKWIFDGTVLDSELIASIRHSRIALLNGYEKFTMVYENFNSIKEEIVSSAIKIGTLPIFSVLESETQHKFLELYELLKISEKNKKRNLIDEKDLLMSLRKSMSKEKAFHVFRDYYHLLYLELFRQSREIKKNSPLSTSEEARQQIVDYLKDVQSEVTLLGVTIDNYREFLLSTDPNPYVRARMGFSEWVLGPESKESKHLHKFGYSIESLSRLYTQLIDSIERGPDWNLSKETTQQEQIEKVLHEIGAPLISEKLMQSRLEHLIELFEEVNELGSFHSLIVHQMGNWLGKALRYDWRYHILHRYPEFHELYTIHMGLVTANDDMLHQSRLNKFKRVLGELREWVATRETAKHSHDIELDINDIKGYLQEFLAHVQRTLGHDKNEMPMESGRNGESFSHQLLEYRYLFGQFLHQLNEENTEEHLIRSQFYFVDQYFEAIDKKVNDLVGVN